MNFAYTRYSDLIVLTITGIGEYGDDVKLLKLVENLMTESFSTIAINFSQIDTINSAAVAAIIYLVKYGDENNFDVVFFAANDKIHMIIERALPKYSINIFTEDEFYKKYNITV